MTLYDISQNFVDFKKFIEQLETVPEFETEEEKREWMEWRDSSIDAIGDTIASIEADAEEKIDNITNLYKSLLAEAEAIKKEKKRLAERQSVKERIAENLKKNLSFNMQEMDMDKFENSRHRLSFRKSEAVQIHNEQAFIYWADENAKDLLTYKTSVNKKAVKDVIKAHSLPEVETYAEIVTNQNIQIK